MLRALRSAISLRKSKWKLLPSWRAFAEASEKTRGAHVHHKRPKAVIALADAKVVAQLSQDNVMSRDHFLEFVTHVSCLKRGMCGI